MTAAGDLPGARSLYEGAPTGAADAALQREVTGIVLEQVNREGMGKEKTDTVRVSERVAVLLAAELRRRGVRIEKVAEERWAEDIARRVSGLGFLDLLLPPARTDLSEIAVYSSGLVQVMPRGQVRWQTVDLRPDAGEVVRVLDTLLGPQNRSLNEANPTVNARLPATPANPGGGRIKALHPCIAPPGRNPAVNIRLFEQRPVTPDWLLERGMLTLEQLQRLANAVRGGERLLICGGTRTGKTTLLSALCAYLPEAWRIVKIEDPQEIWVGRETVQTIEARPQALGTGVAPYTLADGVDDALRLSPDYLVIGEVRDGRAALALFRALLTGHSGACTFHAASPQEAVRRLATILGADAGVAPSEARAMVADAVDLLVQIGIVGEERRVTGIEPPPSAN